MSAVDLARKRKEPKKRGFSLKDDEPVTMKTTPPIANLLRDINDDFVTIHVQKEDGLGGGICAKCVFFVLLSALAVLVGLILFEQQQLNQIDHDLSAKRESKYAAIFEGWTEDIAVEEHGDHDDTEEQQNAVSRTPTEHSVEHIKEREEEEKENDKTDSAEQADTGSTEYFVAPLSEELQNAEEDKLIQNSGEENSINDENLNSNTEVNTLDVDQNDEEESSETLATGSAEIMISSRTTDEYETEEREINRHQNVEHLPPSDHSQSDDEEPIEMSSRTRDMTSCPAYASMLFDAFIENHRTKECKCMVINIERFVSGLPQSVSNNRTNSNNRNQLLQQATEMYIKALHLCNSTNILFQHLARNCISTMRSIGHYSKTIPIHRQLIARFPLNPAHRNQLVVSYLLLNRVDLARKILKEVLLAYPDNVLASAYLGFILKTSDHNYHEAVILLNKALRYKQPELLDGRFYYHLGDALTRLNKTKEATKIYEDATSHGLFLSAHQRSLYNVNRLTAKPFWLVPDFPLSYRILFQALVSHWTTIRREVLFALDVHAKRFQPDVESLRRIGSWRQMTLFSQGRRINENCLLCPATCSIVTRFPAAQCRRGQIKFSVMTQHTHIWPHCGPTNCRLRAHLGLNIPNGTVLRVAQEIRTWKEGELIIFDDSFEHEAWHNGTGLRVILIVDVWHPELTETEKESLSTI